MATDRRPVPYRRDEARPALKQPGTRTGTNLVRDAPGLARVFASSYLRTIAWTVETGLSAGTHVVRRTLAGDSPVAILQDATNDLRSIAAQLLGLSAIEPSTPTDEQVRGASAAELRARGADLLGRSADVNEAEDTHPAYARILSEMSPDEARILRLLATKGPQPTVDVRTNRPLGIGSELVASGLSMIGEHAGCRNVDRTNAYLNNLFRLGLVWFSRESIDPQRYQLIEAQPKVTDAMRRAGRAPKTIHRSIHLTAFGQDFCEVCLPLGNGRAIDGTVVEPPMQPGEHDPNL